MTNTSPYCIVRLFTMTNIFIVHTRDNITRTIKHEKILKTSSKFIYKQHQTCKFLNVLITFIVNLLSLIYGISISFSGNSYTVG